MKQKTLIRHFYKGFSGYKPRRNVDSPAQNLFYLVIREVTCSFLKFSTDQLLVFNLSKTQVNLSRGIQFLPCL